jgi:hypothetical protein
MQRRCKAVIRNLGYSTKYWGVVMIRIKFVDFSLDIFGTFI